MGFLYRPKRLRKSITDDKHFIWKPDRPVSKEALLSHRLTKEQQRKKHAAAACLFLLCQPLPSFRCCFLFVKRWDNRLLRYRPVLWFPDKSFQQLVVSCKLLFGPVTVFGLIIKAHIGHFIVLKIGGDTAAE